jgi:hypothetical protein
LPERLQSFFVNFEFARRSWELGEAERQAFGLACTFCQDLKQKQLVAFALEVFIFQKVDSLLLVAALPENLGSARKSLSEKLSSR